ncbi:hypothetical protein BJ944DRAFT_233206 [Cunninghamella echinulata]|nr:hypothetical protein BJ944DRAFT_233206 [Cunninghamella echinulata]
MTFNLTRHSAPHYLLDANDENLNYVFETRHCKVSTLLNSQYSELKNIFRKYSEEYTLLRFDAINLVNLHVRRIIEGNIQRWNELMSVPVDNLELQHQRYENAFMELAFPEPDEQSNYGYIPLPDLTNEIGGATCRSNINAIRELNITYQEHFVRLRQDENGQSLYTLPSTVQSSGDSTHNQAGYEFANEIIPNIKNHLGRDNVKTYIKQTWIGFINQLMDDHVINQLPRNYTVRKLENKDIDGYTAQRIVIYLYFLLSSAIPYTKGKKWSLLPFGTCQAVKAPVSNKMFFYLLHRLQIRARSEIQFPEVFSNSPNHCNKSGTESELRIQKISTFQLYYHRDITLKTKY